MDQSKFEFARDVRISSSEFQGRAEAFFSDGSFRAELNEFWTRHGTLLESYSKRFWQDAAEDIHVETMSALFGQPIAREALVDMSAVTMTMTFTATKETDWMKNFARLGLASWLADREDQMVETLTEYCTGLVEEIVDQSANLKEALADIQFLNRVAMLQFEVMASFRAKLEARHAESAINRKGNDFVTSLAGKIDSSLKVSESVNQGANEANKKISGLRQDTTEAAAISEQSAQAMKEAAQTAGDLLEALNSLTDGLRDGRDILATSIELVETSANDNAQVVSEVSAIEDVVRTISQIAEQTNILALNASIEAARAGVSGAGFAVVAQEVKNLATQTAKATDTVTEQISAIQASSEKSRQSSDQMVDTVNRLHATSDLLLTTLNEQLGGFSKITDAVDETAKGAASMGDLVASVSRDTDAVAQMVQRLSDASNGTASQLSSLVEETSEFVRKIGT